ncbi:hypothetical protein C1645_816855 [Glomus cerebriforme]|uniref:Uncharacterized protein n=1 Tax=Glomus cerebriforme TaxID=658196 RepID=A0A397TK14_9GLOM|nr:hypothetical protein C1645_816855 [Glomus cerebriforme]
MINGVPGSVQVTNQSFTRGRGRTVGNKKDFEISPPEEHIHALVSPPKSTATSEVLKLREEVASLKEKLSKSEYEFDIVVKPKQKANKWTINIEQGTLSDLKDYIRELPPALETMGQCSTS